jgi:hypothetical protein
MYNVCEANKIATEKMIINFSKTLKEEISLIAGANIMKLYRYMECNLEEKF